jgi:hypothetical protein
VPNLSLQNPSKNQPLASSTWRGLTSIGNQQGQCSTQAKVKGIVPRVEWHCSDSSAANNPLEAPGGTPLYLCLPPIRRSEGGDHYFPITLMKKTWNKNLSKAGILQYRSTCLDSLNRGPVSLVNHARELYSHQIWGHGAFSIRTNDHKTSPK